MSGVALPSADQLGQRRGLSSVAAMFDVLDVKVRVESASVELLQYWSTVYGAFRAQPTEPQITVRVEETDNGGAPRSGAAFIAASGVEHAWDGEGQLFPPLGTPPLNHWLYLHGTAVGRAGQAVLIVSPPHTGKTPLAVALVARGAWLLSDGVAALDPDDLLLAPFPKALRLRPEALDALGIDRAHPALTPFRTRAGAVEWRADPRGLLGRRSAREAADIGAVVFLYPTASPADPQLEPVRPGEALFRMLGNLWVAPTEFVRAVDALIRLCRRTPAYLLRAGPPRPTARLVDQELLA